MLPGGKTKIATYAAALFLLREQLGDEEGVLIMEKTYISFLRENNAVDETLTEEYLEEEQGKEKDVYIRYFAILLSHLKILKI